MKPNFALNFSHDTISLLHRTARGWLEIGATPIDAPDLGEALSYLRRSALGLAPHGVTTKLIIPDDQILYLALPAPGPTDVHRDAQIRAALEGRTPYAVEDLVFDWAGEGPVVQVAVIARETLQEAESFAQQYRFNPVSFVGLPDPASFDGEPWFGPSEAAAQLLPEGEFVERDSAPVVIISREPASRGRTPAADDAPAAAEPTPMIAETVEEPAPVAEVAEAELPAPETIEVEPDAPEQAPEVAAEPVPEPAPEAPALSILSDTNLTLPADVALYPAPPMTDAGPPPVEISAPVRPAGPEVIPPVIAGFRRPPAAKRAAPPPPVAIAVPEEVSPPAPVTPALPPEIVASQEASFVAPMPTDLPPPDLVLPADALAAPAAPRGKLSVTSVTSHRRAPAAPLTPPQLTPAAGTARVYDPDPAEAEGDLPPPVPAAVRQARANAGAAPLAAPQRAVKDAKAAKGLGSLVTAPGIAGLRGKAAKPTKSAKAVPPEVTLVAPPPTTEGDLPFAKVRPSTRGKPRYLGLILTGLLLLALAIIAAWSSFSASTETPAVIEATDADTAGQPAAATDPQAAPATADPVVETPAPQTDPSIEDEAAADGQLTDAPAAAPAEETIAPATPGDSGAAAPAPPAAGQDEIILSTTDTPPAAADALALVPPQAAADAPPQAPAPPPPFGTQYEFDANGLIRPTETGIVTPEGVRLVAGPPPIVPPARPASVVEKARALAPATAEVPEAAPPAAAPYADPALEGFRPRPRPETLQVPSPPATVDDAALTIPAESQMVSLRPQPRPASVASASQAAADQQRQDEEAQRVAEAASLSATAAAEALATVPQGELGPRSPLAVPISRRPPPKPSNFDATIQTAVAAAISPQPIAPTPEPEVIPAPVAASVPAPEPVPEPAPRRTRTPAPEPTIMPSPKDIEPGDDEQYAPAAKTDRITTSGSVAKNATFANAINLGKTNLIGVYGTPSKRYAMIRTSNGQYKKVRVGDRVDGGTVAAITESELRYQKGGRMLTLALPRG